MSPIEASICSSVRQAFTQAAILPRWVNHTGKAAALLTLGALGCGIAFNLACLPVLVFAGGLGGHVLARAAHFIRSSDPDDEFVSTPEPRPLSPPIPSSQGQYYANLLADRADLPTPTVYSIPEPGHGGYLSELDIFLHERTLTGLPGRQTMGVIGHEVGHLVANTQYFDRLPLRLAQVLLVRHELAAITVEAARYLRAVSLGALAMTAPLAAAPISFAVAALACAVTPYALHITARAARRQSEFNADRIAAALIGSPLPLAQALRNTERENLVLLMRHDLDAQPLALSLRSRGFSPALWFHRLATYDAPFTKTHPSITARRKKLHKLPRNPERLAQLKDVMA